MNQLPADFTLPDTTNPPECAEFLRTGDESWANQRVAAVIEVDGHLVQFVGIGPELADAEFVRLANVAADRVRDAF